MVLLHMRVQEAAVNASADRLFVKGSLVVALVFDPTAIPKGSLVRLGSSSLMGLAFGIVTLTLVK